MAVDERAECQRNCWLVSAAGGVLVALLLWIVGHFSFPSAIFFGLMFLGLFGGFLVWAFCSGSAEVAELPETPGTRTAAAAAVGTAAAGEAVARAQSPTPKAAPKPEAAPKPKAEPATESNTATPRPPAVVEAQAKRAVKGTAPKSEPPAKPKAKKAKPAAKPKAAKSGEPEMLKAPRGGKGDDLKQIKGVGPGLEKALNDLGVWHFDQIAGWSAKDVAWVDDNMTKFKGRIARDGWVKQAKLLAKGGETEFSKRVNKGDVY